MTQDTDRPHSTTKPHAPIAAAQEDFVAAAANKPTVELSEAERKKHRTTGNRVFDLIVYPVIAFGVVLVASAKALNYVKKGEGKPWFDRQVNHLANGFKSIPVYGDRDAETLHANANNFGKVLVSFGVGTVLMLPIKLLEDRRTQISKWFDKVLNTEPKKESDYKEEPKQSWKSVFGGRGITFASVWLLSSIIGGKPTETVEDFVSDHVKSGLKTSSTWLADKKVINRPISEPRLESIRGQAKYYTFEIFYTALCATLVYTLSRLIARKDDDKRHAAETPKTPIPPTPTVIAEDAQNALSKLVPEKAERPEKFATQSLRRDTTYGMRQDKPAADFRTKYQERQAESSQALAPI